MSGTAIKIENISKEYRLGEVGTGTLSHDLQRWWARVRGREDSYSTLDAGGTPVKPNPGYIRALDDISLDIHEGDTLGIIGRNGAGKSTLLKVISRITAPTAGVIKARGRIASLLEVGTGMHPELTGRENLYLNGAILGMKKHEVAARFDEIVEFSGCRLYIDTPIKRYSTGMRVRLAFSVAAHLDAEILIVDEVLAVGDFSFQRKCLDKMGEIAAGGRTVIFVSHNIGAVGALCNKAIVLNSGKLEYDGDVEGARKIYFNRVVTAASEKFMEDDGCPLSIRRVAMGKGSLGNGTFDIREPIDFAIDYDVKFELKGANLVLMVKDGNGAIVFRAWDIDEAKSLYDNREPGRYRAVYSLGGKLLNTGMYYVSVACGQPNKAAFSQHEDILTFEVVSSSLNAAEYSFSRGGVVISQGSWRTSTLGIRE